jgi:hypothetical protein
MARRGQPTSGLLEFAEDDFIIHKEELDFGPQIGEGNFSTVYLARYFGEHFATTAGTARRQLPSHLYVAQAHHELQ